MSEAGAASFAQLIAFARNLYPSLDGKSYYQLLSVLPNADLATIRAAYYRAAGHLHPDRYATLPDPVAREQLESIFARISEGYRVLTSPDKRGAYDRGLLEGKMRFDLNPRERGPKNPEDTLVNAEAKKFFRMGMICLGKKDWKGAVMNFNFARTFEPTAKVVLEKLAEAQAALKSATPPKAW